MIFRQLFEPVSSTYTYLLACPKTRAAVLIDPVVEMVERDLQVIAALGLRLDSTIETHIHADHITGAAALKAATGCHSAGPAMDQMSCRDVGLREGEVLRVGTIEIDPLFTPGHTDTHHSYLVDTGSHKMVFTGDGLLIEGCGRTDFQSGDAVTLYRTIHDKLFTLPEETLVYPGHDYNGRQVSSIGQEKHRNPRLGGGKGEAEFVAIMAGLNLAYPQKIDISLPANHRCGAPEAGTAEE